MPGTADFAKMVPGFDFLQGLLKNAGASLPSMGQWIAPTLNPEELEKRIEELRTVQFWLEQNARMLGATIQALEVQRMTLSTLKTMNLPLDQLRQSMTLHAPEAAPSAAAPPAAPTAATAPPAAGAADPMRWWGALTQQFTELAAGALKDVGVDAPRAGAAAPPRSGGAGRASAPAAGAAKKATARRTGSAGASAPRKRRSP